MITSNPQSTARIAGHPIHPMIVPFPIAFFVAAFVTDLMFISNGEAGWATASMWLLGAGLVTAALAAVAGLIDFFGEPRIRGFYDAWAHLIGNLTAVVLEAVNLFLRYAGGSDVVDSTGVILSGLAVLLLLYTGWKGGELVYRHRVGVADADQTPIV
jgi:uncharacterized membrane protein